MMGDYSFVFVLLSSSLINGMSMELKCNFLAKKFAGVYSASAVQDRYRMSCKLTLSYMSASGAN